MSRPVLTPAGIVDVVAAVTNVTAERMRSPAAIDDGVKLRPSGPWTPARKARGLALYLIGWRCRLATDHAVSALLAIAPLRIADERDAFRELMRRSPELRAWCRRAEDILPEVRLVKARAKG